MGKQVEITGTNLGAESSKMLQQIATDITDEYNKELTQDRRNCSTTPSPTTAGMRSSSRMLSLTPSRTHRSSQLSRRQIQEIETPKAESRDDQTSLGVSS